VEGEREGARVPSSQEDATREELYPVLAVKIKNKTKQNKKNPGKKKPKTKQTKKLHCTTNLLLHHAGAAECWGQ